MNSNLYNDLVRARLRTLLVGLENHLLTSRAEPTLPHRAASKALTIEHVMPVKWEENWSLPGRRLKEEQLDPPPRQLDPGHAEPQLDSEQPGLRASGTRSRPIASPV